MQAFGLLALMESADPRLILLMGLLPLHPCRLSGSRSYLFAITPCRTLRNLLMCYLLSRFVISVVKRAYAAWPTKFGWYVRSWANKAQIVRAVLLARATTTTFAGRRSAKRNAHSGGALALLSTVSRMVIAPILFIGPLPPRFDHCIDEADPGEDRRDQNHG